MTGAGKTAFFAKTIAGLCAHCRVMSGKKLRYLVIANPKAGGFTIPGRWRVHRNALREALVLSAKNSERDAEPAESFPGGLIETTGPRSAVAYTKALLEEAARDTEPFFLVITAGGDGTSLEVLETIYTAAALRKRFIVLRLPMGTGNDGADARDMASALSLLHKKTNIKLVRAVSLGTASGKTWTDGRNFFAFNILSIGLDAFVTHMTNRMKGRLPGDSYKLWVDIAALFYDKLYKVGPMELRAFDEKGAECARFTKKLLLCAVGESGRRTYGSRKMILPDDRNVCAIAQMPLWRKIAFKEMFNTGAHAGKPEASLFTAKRVVINGRQNVLAQMDGETVLLRRDDFPVTIELGDPAIQILEHCHTD
ncbi:MAG: diacylglycerol kinase [Treponema sp.]|jgi:diacylglycerol kinase family enzyme|nr:diacylglycerol kinase [Treponema sp.]